MADMKLIQPQEVEVLYILPAIRRELAKEMKKQGLEQKKIAGLLFVTEAAVSQEYAGKYVEELSDEEKMQLISACSQSMFNKKAESELSRQRQEIAGGLEQIFCRERQRERQVDAA